MKIKIENIIEKYNKNIKNTEYEKKRKILII